MIKNKRAPSYQKLSDDPSVQPKYAAVAGYQKQDPNALGSLTLDNISALDKLLNSAGTKGKTLYLKRDSTGTLRLSTHRSLWGSKQEAQDAVCFIHGLGFGGTTEHTTAVQPYAQKPTHLTGLGTVKKLKCSAELRQCVRELKQTMEKQAGGPSHTTFTVDDSTSDTDGSSDTSSASPAPRTIITPNERLDDAAKSYFG